ncbi:putative indole-3-pyruvate monooxygenase YUCCA10 [Apium graveolens]|uniref:putative indole-3-pyruvate monooxygenase YUCCA10 n=1 Tax=Apium graveolens TaxID=4045 RepID=UPI003D7A46FE
MEVKETVVIIVGAGPSGLATAACLKTHSIPYIILEREDCFASIWKHKSYDRVHLHLAKQLCQLPFMSFPKSCPTFVSKKQFLQYLDDYVTRFNIKPLYQRQVVSAFYDENSSKWKIKATTKGVSNEFEEYSSRFLVVATGETCDAYRPEVEGLSKFAGDFVHSTEYKSGEIYENKHVLVVGCGNSGMEIALDLANHGAKVSVVVRRPVHVLSRGMVHWGLSLLKYFPYYIVDFLMVLFSKIKYGDLSKYGIHRPQEGPFSLKVKSGKYPVIDVGTCHKIKSGEIQVLPGLRSIGESEVLFEDSRSYPFDSIIFATGFTRSTKTWLKGDSYLLNDDGIPKPEFPKHWKGEKGLYCVGLARRGLYGAAMDAQNIANDIIKFV